MTTEAQASGQRAWINWLLAAPFLFSAGVVLWAALFAEPESCGSQAPGLCFSLALLTAFIIGPLATLCTPVLLFRWFRAWRKARR